ncbi:MULTISPECIES: alpha/beta fold hydrolase [unclassified Herbaspirillum]|uniref:alpha/beta fold hydrolase n=1 Tax=unclassified Herbaspirillum TaxID=2624150 RepID=UPI0011541426|nr:MULTISPECIES: alpha/beta hydrolase [unclassified Herbaspirillum]MBB5393794.1 pimeloyl-ACP methyl ester carboxylesterase [Herbaspirillum sp. SJZ102]TQK01346.1 pimeloyl-ACP methyl ester carboxylesterase [Herbaspirillum sp. SJZ130]TQK05742.1 pimeloyl-ACP methyl ester carboxylesterase [Herbaspirillum sp. SJZ106]TWC65114.1 pimeloyl-ACP methyl ester carboxylesterase [Herbaspirillum sp. SJZ099]
MKKTLYLLCGLLCDEVVWAAQAQALQDDYDVRVITFLQQDSMQAMAEKVLADAPANFALAGHSMGGRVALEVCRRAPQRVERLALLDTGYEAAAPGEADKRALLVRQALAEGTDAIAAAWGLPMLAPCHREDPHLVQAIFDMVGRMTGKIYAAQTHALLNRPDAADVLASLACPTLLLCGKQDGWSPPQRHERMAQMVPHAVLELVDDCGHMSMMEQPEAVLQAMRRWLASR